MNSTALKAVLKSRTTLFVAGALIVGAIGGKMFWIDSTPAIRVPIASAKPAVKATTPRTNASISASNKQAKGIKQVGTAEVRSTKEQEES